MQRLNIIKVGGGVVEDESSLASLLRQFAAMEGRKGGYTRILKLGPRRGDAAPMALLELV